MEPKVRFLLVGDRPGELQVLESLRRAGYSLEHGFVDRLEPGTLREVGPCDFVLASSIELGLSAFRTVQDWTPVPPVILLVEREHELKAFEAVKSGLFDYLLRDNLLRLPLAVDRALREVSVRSSRSRAEAQLAGVYRVYQIHSGINKAIFHGLSSPGFLQQVCALATRFGRYALVRILQRQEQGLVTVATARSSLAEKWGEPGTSLEESTMETGVPRIENSFQTGGSAGCFPMSVASLPWGCLTFYAQVEDIFDAEEISLLGEVAHDVAWAVESRQREVLRRETDQFLQDMTNLVPGLFYKLMLTPEQSWKFLYLSPGIDLFVPFTPAQVLENPDLMLGAIHPHDLGRYTAAVNESARNLTVFSHEFRLIRPNSSVVWTLSTSFPERLPDGSIVWSGLAIDMTPQHKLQETLQREQELLAVTLQNIGDGAIAIGEEGQVVLINRAAQELLQWNEATTVGRHWSVLSIRLPWEARDTLTPWTVNLADGRTLHLETHVSDLLDSQKEIRGRVMLLRDVTQRDKIEERLRQSEKLESIGLLAGGIAHDFNNLLTGMFGFLQLAKMNTDAPELVTQYLDNALGPFDRARALTQQLLTFAKGGQPRRTRFGVLESLNSTLDFLLTGVGIESGILATEPPWLITANEGQIVQVFENLILNARQVLEPTGGRIDVRLFNRRDEYQELGLPLGDYLVIEVQDNGPGIPSSVLPRIFDPFFTTKATGTGLGLSICFSVVKKHEGAIEVESTPGKGTCFRVYLPASPV